MYKKFIEMSKNFLEISRTRTRTRASTQGIVLFPNSSNLSGVTGTAQPLSKSGSDVAFATWLLEDAESWR